VPRSMTPITTRAPELFAVRTPLARLMVLSAPGGLETSFDRLSQPTSLESPPVPQGPPSEDEQAALGWAFEDAGVTFTGPPPSAMLAGADG
jgi:hypothetical protein